VKSINSKQQALEYVRLFTGALLIFNAYPDIEIPAESKPRLANQIDRTILPEPEVTESGGIFIIRRVVGVYGKRNKIIIIREKVYRDGKYEYEEEKILKDNCFLPMYR
jgi:hypothetical protein